MNAAKDVEVIANGKDSIVSVVAGASGGQVGVAGTFTVTILNTHTHACLGSWTDEEGSRGCNAATSGVTIVAGNNVLISARDDTRIMQITASLAGGYVGVGVAVGVALMTKDTQAYIGAGSHIDAKALERGIRACAGSTTERSPTPSSAPVPAASSATPTASTASPSRPRRARTSSA